MKSELLLLETGTKYSSLRFPFFGGDLNNDDLTKTICRATVSLKQWFAAVVHSCRLRKSGSAHCYSKKRMLIA